MYLYDYAFFISLTFFFYIFKNWYTEFKKWLGSERVRVLAVSSAKHIEVGCHFEYKPFYCRLIVDLVRHSLTCA